MTDRIPSTEDLPFEDRLSASDRMSGRDVDRLLGPPPDDGWPGWGSLERGQPPEGGEAQPAAVGGSISHDGVVYRQAVLGEYEPPELARNADGEDAGPDAIWTARPVFSHIHQFARSRRVAPWAVLASVLARVVAATPPTIQLPAIIGSNASLNLFVGLVGPSGSGKDSARSVAREAVDVVRHARGRTFEMFPLGSGEGLSHMFMRRPKATKENPNPELEQYNEAALVTVSEVDTLGSLATRQSSTVMAQLRQAAMGEQLGFFYVDTAKRMLVPEHSYRLCLVAGIQPRRAEVLLNEAEEAGGTPQRFVWIPVIDRDAPDVRPETPGVWPWQPPDWGIGVNEMKVCHEAAELIEANQLKRARHEADVLDGHALLTRLKVGASLGLLDGRCEVTAEDWDLAGLIMEMSDLTRGAVGRALRQEREEQNIATAEAEAKRASVLRSRHESESARRVADGVRRALSALDEAGWLSRSELRKRLASGIRDSFDSVILAMIDAGEVEGSETANRGQSGEQFRLRR